MVHKNSFFLLLFLLVLCSFMELAYADSELTGATEATAQTDLTYTFSGSVFGDAPTYTWCWGDGTSNTTTIVPYATHSYDHEGTYQITLTIMVTLDLGDDWDVSGDWQQVAGVYSASVDITPTYIQEVGSNLLSSLGLFVVLPIILALSVFLLVFFSLKNKIPELPAKQVVAAIVLVLVSVMFIVIMYFISAYVVSVLS